MTDPHIIYEGKRPIFVVTIKQHKNTLCEFDVEEVIAWTEENEIYNTEDYLSLTVKWDSCSHLTIGEEIDNRGRRDGYLHLCGAESFKNHCRLLKELYNLAFEKMERKPQKGEEWIS